MQEKSYYCIFISNISQINIFLIISIKLPLCILPTYQRSLLILNVFKKKYNSKILDNKYLQNINKYNKYYITLLEWWLQLQLFRIGKCMIALYITRA